MRKVVIVQNTLWVVASLQGDCDHLDFISKLMDSSLSRQTFTNVEIAHQ